jgi:hypothetical protein
MCLVQLFNTGMEALLARQGEWRVSSSGTSIHTYFHILTCILYSIMCMFMYASACILCQYMNDCSTLNLGLREHMSAQLLEAILPVYTEFFNTYASVKFSKKHMNEYLRFQPAQVERNLKTFFGRS